MKNGRFQRFIFKPFCLAPIYYLILVCCLGLTACSGKKSSVPDYHAPFESTFEMVAFGATIAINSQTFPESIDAELITDGYRFVRSKQSASLYFAPHPDYANQYDASHPERSDYPYVYYFSESIDTDFVRLPPSSYKATVNSMSASYDSELQFFNNAENLMVDGNHLIVESEFSAPVRATHVELWHRTSPDAEPELVRRVALNSFYAWRHYFRPLILANR